jgi:GT2 family glycosyltransferase
MSDSAVPIVAIIVLTWNQRDLTVDCLASLAEMDYPADRLQIIVADNGSRDGTAATVRERYPHVTVLENGDNLGFAEGNNVGIRHALQGPARYIMLLNNDTAVDRQMLNELLTAMGQRPDVGIVGPKMLYFEPSNIIWCAGNRIDWRTGGSMRLQAEEPDKGIIEQPREADFITACAILLRREVIEQTGLLDPRFFIYYEETDWCVRAHQAGWRILYVPAARLWHKVSAAMGTTSPATDYYMNRNVLLFLTKNLKGTARAQAVIRAAGRNLLAAAAYAAKPHGGQRIPNRNARLLALRDAILHRWGKMGPDVAKVCYPNR